MASAESFTSTFRSEVARLARKELRAVVGPVQRELAKAKKTVQEQKREVAGLQRSVKHLTKLLAQKGDQIGDTEIVVEAERGGKWRKDSVRSTRRRLQVTQAEFAALLGASHGSVNGWETGRTEPRESAKRKVLALRKLTPAAARAKLDELG